MMTTMFETSDESTDESTDDEGVVNNLVANKKTKRRIKKVYTNSDLLVDDKQFTELVHEIQQSINNGLHPIPDPNNKGVYSVHNTTQQNIGVFRPMDEEWVPEQSASSPNKMNWRWFGCARPPPKQQKQSYTVPKQRYLSEVCASIIDQKLGLNIVPKTKLVALSSEKFKYTAMQRIIIAAKQTINRLLPIFTRTLFPAKIGSLKCFTEGFSDIECFQNATSYLTQYQPTCDKSLTFKSALQFEYEKYVVLDYLIGNTEINENDWLIKYDKNCSQERITNKQISNNNEHLQQSPTILPNHSNSKQKFFRIVAINVCHGFPFEPFCLADRMNASLNRLGMWAEISFSAEIRYLVLPKLCDLEFVNEIIAEIRTNFERDIDYDVNVFEKQMRLMRGHIMNLIFALLNGYSPLRMKSMKSKKLSEIKFLNFFNNYAQLKYLNM